VERYHAEAVGACYRDKEFSERVLIMHESQAPIRQCGF